MRFIPYETADALVRSRPRVMKMSPQNIRMFVAGALALMGFRSLLWAPHYFIVSKDLVFTITAVLSGLALWIGIAMLTGSGRALFWAWIYLLIDALNGAVSICLSVFPILPKPVHIGWWPAASELATAVILLWLLVRGREQNHHRTSDTTSEESRQKVL